MKLVAAHPWARQHKPQSISDAIEWAATSDYGEGQMEAISTKLSKLTRSVGSLTEMLHERGVLSNVDIETLLPSHREWIASEE